MDAGFHEKPRMSVAAESKRSLLEKRHRHALDPYLLARSQEINAKNRAAHDMRSAACPQGLSIAHICPQ